MGIVKILNILFLVINKFVHVFFNFMHCMIFIEYDF